MKGLFREKFTVETEEKGGSVARAQGYMDGEVCGRRGESPSKYALVGIDEYCLGFRAGYFERKRAGSVRRADREIEDGGAGSPRKPTRRLKVFLRRCVTALET